jgi:hypothetical protein
VSDAPTDPTAGQPGGQQPSEEEVRAYLGQLRAAPVDQVLAEVLSSLLNAAQVKIGRRDARVLLDATSRLVEQVRHVLPDELTGQLDDVFAQLRTAQVQAEPEVAAAAQQGQVEQNDVSAEAAGDDGASSGAGEQPSEAPPSEAPRTQRPGDAASRLWVPGR